MHLSGVRLRCDVPGCFRAVASPYGRSFGKRNLSLEMCHLWGAPLAVWVDNGVRCPLGYLVKRPHVVTRYQSWPGRRSGGGDYPYGWSFGVAVLVPQLFWHSRPLPHDNNVCVVLRLRAALPAHRVVKRPGLYSDNSGNAPR